MSGYAEANPTYELNIVNNQLVYANGPLKGTPFDTLDPGDNWAGTGKAIFVMSPEGNIYASKSYPVAEFHHSSFLAGEKVAAAGTIDVAQGKILEITNDTGHYQTSQENNKQLLKELKDRGLSDSELNDIVMSDYDK